MTVVSATSNIYLFKALKEAATFNIVAFLSETDKRAISCAHVVFKLAIYSYRYDCHMIRCGLYCSVGIEEANNAKTCTRTWLDVQKILVRKALEKEGRSKEEIDRRLNNLSITGCCM